jgi:UDP-2,3-diacylglucosamine hydrolase
MVRWLDSIKADAGELYLMGDIFDFWFEYKNVVPKGFVRVLGKLAELSDAGVKIHFFTGNHDIWTFGYLEREIGLTVHREPQILSIGNKRFYLAHGDRLGEHSAGVRVIQAVFHNRLCQILFSMLPSSWAMKFGLGWSKSNRRKPHRSIYAEYLGEDRENLVRYAKSYPREQQVDIFVFGHRHILLDLMLGNGSRVCILGDWFVQFTYGVFDGEEFYLEYFEDTAVN